MQHNRHRTKNARKLPLLLSVPLTTVRYSLTACLLYYIGTNAFHLTTAVAASRPPYSSTLLVVSPTGQTAYAAQLSTANNSPPIASTLHSAPTPFPTDFKNTPAASSFPSN